MTYNTDFVEARAEDIFEDWVKSFFVDLTPLEEAALYALALDCTSYQQFIDAVGCEFTFDGVRWDDPMIDHEEMDEMLDEMHD